MTRPDGAPATRAGSGLGFALLSAASFGLSGALARPLLDAGWTAGAVVLVRIALGALIVVPFGVRALRGRWHLVRAQPRAGRRSTACSPSPARSSATSPPSQHMQVGPALLIEYTAPAAVVVWLWLRARPATPADHARRRRASPRSAWCSCSTCSPAPT